MPDKHCDKVVKSVVIDEGTVEFRCVVCDCLVCRDRMINGEWRRQYLWENRHAGAGCCRQCGSKCVEKHGDVYYCCDCGTTF